MQRRLELIILGHLWVLAPFVLAWFLVPQWRTPRVVDVRALGALAVITSAYVLARTINSIWRWRAGLDVFWPYVDVLVITMALSILRDPTHALAMAYVVPLASAVASLSMRRLIGLTTVIVAGLLFVIVWAGVPWTVSMVYRLVIIAVIGSVYAAIIRTVAAYERAAERAEYQQELAREIHDGIQYLLATITARLELAHHLLKKAPERAGEIIALERETSRRAADELRYLVRRLRTADEHVDLASALRRQVIALAGRWEFDLNVDIPPELPRLRPAAEHAILRTIQESLTNAVKHASASKVDVRLSVTARDLRCAIHDNGVGFDPSVEMVDGGGLTNLQDRVHSAGGSLNIESVPAQGTVVTASFPLPGGWVWSKSVS